MELKKTLSDLPWVESPGYMTPVSCPDTRAPTPPPLHPWTSSEYEHVAPTSSPPYTPRRGKNEEPAVVEEQLYQNVPREKGCTVQRTHLKIEFYSTDPDGELDGTTYIELTSETTSLPTVPPHGPLQSYPTNPHPRAKETTLTPDSPDRGTEYIECCSEDHSDTCSISEYSVTDECCCHLGFDTCDSGAYVTPTLNIQ